MITFAELRNRYVLQCSLKADSGIHIGTGTVSATTDAPFVRQMGTPFIPGSSLRGAMRSTVERLVRTLVPQGPSRFCALFEEGPHDGCVAGNSKLRDQFEQLDADEQTRQVKQDQVRLCAICRLFGSTIMAAKLKVTDAMPLADAPAPVKRDGVGISRDTETAQEKIKYDFEVLEPACDFRLSLIVENAEGDDFALLYVLLRELQHGLDVGGKKSRGLGRVRLVSYQIAYLDQERGYSVLDYLSTGLKSDQPELFEGWLKQHFEEFCRREGVPC